MSQYTKGSLSIKKIAWNIQGEIEGHLVCEKSSTEASEEYCQSIEYIRNISSSAKMIFKNERKKQNENFLVEVQLVSL